MRYRSITREHDEMSEAITGFKSDESEPHAKQSCWHRFRRMFGGFDPSNINEEAATYQRRRTIPFQLGDITPIVTTDDESSGFEKQFESKKNGILKKVSRRFKSATKIDGQPRFEVDKTLLDLYLGLTNISKKSTRQKKN